MDDGKIINSFFKHSEQTFLEFSLTYDNFVIPLFSTFTGY